MTRRLSPPLLLIGMCLGVTTPWLVLGLAAQAFGQEGNVRARSADRNDAVPSTPRPPDVAVLRATVLDYTMAVMNGEREKAFNLLAGSDRDKAALTAALEQSRAQRGLATAIRETLGENATRGFEGKASDRATLDRALAQYEVRPGPLGRGWVLFLAPQPRVVRLPELPRELILTDTPQGWRIVPPEAAPAPPWRERQLAERGTRVVGAIQEVAAAVRAGELVTLDAVRTDLRKRVDGALQRWKRDTDAAVTEAARAFARQFEEVAALAFDPEPVQELDFDSDGNRLAVGMINTPRSLHLIDIRSGAAKEVPLSDGERERHVEAMAFVGDRLAVAGAGFDRRRTEATRAAGQRPDFSVGAVAEGRLRLLDPESGAVTATLDGHDGYTTDAVAADGTLYTVGSDNVIRAWTIAEQPGLSWERSFAQLGAPYGVGVAGEVVAVASPLSLVKLFGRKDGRPLSGVTFLAGRLTAPLVGVSPRHLALAAMGEVKVIDASAVPRPADEAAGAHASYSDVPERRLSEEWLGFSRVNDLAAAPAAGLLVSGDGVARPGGLTDPEHGPGVRFWRGEQWEWLGWLPMRNAVTAVAVTPDARLLAVGDVSGHVKVFRLPKQLEPARPRIAEPGGEKDAPVAP